MLRDCHLPHRPFVAEMATLEFFRKLLARSRQSSAPRRHSDSSSSSSSSFETVSDDDDDDDDDDASADFTDAQPSFTPNKWTLMPDRLHAPAARSGHVTVAHPKGHEFYLYGGYAPDGALGTCFPQVQRALCVFVPSHASEKLSSRAITC
jgi:hypothetical protein